METHCYYHEHYVHHCYKCQENRRKMAEASAKYAAETFAKFINEQFEKKQSNNV